MLTGYPETLVDVLAWGRVALMVGLAAMILWLGWQQVGHDGE